MFLEDLRKIIRIGKPDMLAYLLNGILLIQENARNVQSFVLDPIDDSLVELGPYDSPKMSGGNMASLSHIRYTDRLGEMA